LQLCVAQARSFQAIQQGEEIVPGWWMHRLHVADPAELDAEVQAWIRESYRLMGMRERLKRR
jgi:predicted DNA-binding protein (MmcQ/YjbR family)